MNMSIEDILSGAQRWHIEQGDSAVVLTTIPDASIDAIVALRRCAHVKVDPAPFDKHVA